MRIVTIVSLGASAVLGLGALFVAKTVLPNNAQAKAPVAQQVQGIPVVVAAKDIKYGDKLDSSMLTVVQVPPNLAPQGAFTSVPQVLAADKGGPPVALVPLVAREPVLPMKLSGPGARPSVAAEVTEGMRAYTIKVNDVTGVGGHALPGDRVDVMLTRDLTPTGDTRSYVSQVVLQNVRLLGIDLNADLQSNKPATPNTATLEVSVEDAQKLSMASNLGFLSLALRRTGEAELEQASLVRTGDWLLGGSPRAPRVGGPAGPARPVAFFNTSILIVEGESARHTKPASSGKTMTAPAPDAAPAGAAATGGAAAGKSGAGATAAANMVG